MSPRKTGIIHIPVFRSASSRFHARPDFVNEALPGLFLFLLPCGVPCPQTQEAQHVHFVDFLHAPAVLHQFVVGGAAQRHGRAAAGLLVYVMVNAVCLQHFLLALIFISQVIPAFSLYSFSLRSGQGFLNAPVMVESVLPDINPV